VTPRLTVQEALAKATERLTKSQIPSPARDARILMAHALGVDPARITLMAREPVEPEALSTFDDLIRERRDHVPVSHLLGGRDFYGRRFKVTSDVLDPRPETETLIEIALQQPFSEVLDLGTGSGCILITLLAERPDAVGIASDASPEALAIARENAAHLGVDGRCDFMQSDWFQWIGGTYDLIVSNPPYIALDEMASLSRDVLDHEPRMALTDHADGLTAYRKIAAGVVPHLTPGGRLLLEIGPTQAQAVTDLLAAAGLIGIATHTDLDGRDRVISAYSLKSA
jgi:release factor glutamine methyltransferase